VFTIVKAFVDGESSVSELVGAALIFVVYMIVLPVYLARIVHERTRSFKYIEETDEKPEGGPLLTRAWRTLTCSTDSERMDGKVRGRVQWYCLMLRVQHLTLRLLHAPPPGRRCRVLTCSTNSNSSRKLRESTSWSCSCSCSSSPFS
jgi:hypothetical protein